MIYIDAADESGQSFTLRVRMRNSTHLLIGKNLYKTGLLEQILRTWTKRRILVRNDSINDTEQLPSEITPDIRVKTHSRSTGVLIVHHWMKVSLQTLARTLICGWYTLNCRASHSLVEGNHSQFRVPAKVYKLIFIRWYTTRTLREPECLPIVPRWAMTFGSYSEPLEQGYRDVLSITTKTIIRVILFSPFLFLNSENCSSFNSSVECLHRLCLSSIWFTVRQYPCFCPGS
jgi:hypothetical protein